MSPNRRVLAGIARVLLPLFCTLPAMAALAGILPATSRVIYEEGERERSLMLANVNAYPVLVQAWIDDGSGDPGHAQAHFVVLPPVFRLDRERRQGLRIIYSGEPLPRDRESVYWLNLYEIPQIAMSDDRRSQLLLGINTQLKLFYRPRDLPLPPEQIAAKLSFSLVREAGRMGLVCHNPTPYHASFAQLVMIGSGREHAVDRQADMMTPPLSKRTYAVSAWPAADTPMRVRFRLIDDTGTPNEMEIEILPERQP